MDTALPPIPPKRYFTIGEVSDLCQVKAYVLRYWEQEFTQLKPMKRRGNRRYYQHHEVLLIRRIRDLLYEQGFTISGARNQLTDYRAPAAEAPGAAEPAAAPVAELSPQGAEAQAEADVEPLAMAAEHPGASTASVFAPLTLPSGSASDIAWLRSELLAIRRLLDS
jgi:DNA-binding transcriptional MerR regulator